MILKDEGKKRVTARRTVTHIDGEKFRQKNA